MADTDDDNDMVKIKAVQRKKFTIYSGSIAKLKPSSNHLIYYSEDDEEHSFVFNTVSFVLYPWDTLSSKTAEAFKPWSMTYVELMEGTAEHVVLCRKALRHLNLMPLAPESDSDSDADFDVEQDIEKKIKKQTKKIEKLEKMTDSIASAKPEAVFPLLKKMKYN